MKLPAPVENLLRRFRRDPVDDATVVMRLRAEIQDLKAKQKIDQAESLAVAFQSLFTDLTSPLSQLLLQLHLTNNKEHSLAASDVLVHVKKLLEVLEQHGLTVTSKPDDIEQFDPNLHQSILETFKPETGEPVRICFPGITYQGTLLRKAAVVSPEVK